MKIGSKNTESRTYIIAEIGNNHEGNFEVAREMLIAAAQTGVDAVKFQTFKAETYVGTSNPARYEQIKGYELTHEEFKDLANLAASFGIDFLSTPFDLGSAEFLNEIVPAFKISSSDNTFFPLLEKVASFKKPIILSSGLTDIDLIKKTYSFLVNIWGAEKTKSDLAILHCVAAYPTPMEDAQLGSITHLKNELNCTIGYSDHTLGNKAAELSVALGAKIIEKHFTLAHDYSDFRDHQISATPNQMEKLVNSVRNAEKYCGTGKKQIGVGESFNINAMRRSIVAIHPLAKGHVITMDDIAWTRPSGGLVPGQEELIIGKKLVKSIEQGEMLDEAYVS